MNQTHLHLLLNHVPVLGTAFGLGLLAFGLGRQSEDLKKAALVVFVLAALLAVPVYLTGEPAEDAVKALPGVSMPLAERHEQAAAVAFTADLVLGAAALAGLLLFRRGKTVPAWFGSLVLVVSLVASGLMAWTASLGGQLRHTEIRSGAGAPASSRDKNHD